MYANSIYRLSNVYADMVRHFEVCTTSAIYKPKHKKLKYWQKVK